jgi:hypothetical protein
MKIVLVMLNNIQEYILDNIKNLKNHNNNDIIIITDNKFNNYFENKDVQLINIEELLSCYTEHVSKLTGSFRNGFWNLTSYRFKAIYEYMKLYNIENIIHIENDVLIYKDMTLFNFHNTNKILLTIGQYLGGVDPRNKSGNTIGFVNETCIINYSKYKFVWKNENGLKIPYIIINENEYPIINLHIHSKNLKNFI